MSFVCFKTTCYMHHCDSVVALQLIMKIYERCLEDLQFWPLLLMMTIALKS